MDLQQQITEELSTITVDNLKIIAEFVKFIKQKQEIDLLEPINYRRASGSSILSHAGTWEGDDLEECLELMYQTRGKVTVNHLINPFE
ncbi:hypothetical protein CWATWH0402_4487 [Crocosphaera watsonii WH 0402]|uniref:DUF2281 domain-containing protein n=1 Tax=Crocosphaera watsonii WH 0402 TaxID=1284629 RepID=T2JHB8_CROWT|nr:hypothetical protein CWATWH0402_4487 [Crocosphaera watsonii WH 0402]